MNQTAENPPTNLPETPKRPPWGRIIAWGGLFFLLVIVAVGLIRAQQGQFKVGQPAPDFTINSFDGKPFTLSAMKGKVVFVNFWASWCVPCKEEAAILENAYRLYKDRDDVVFLGIAWSDMDTKAMAFIKEYNVTYPNAPDMGTRASQAYRITGVPETYIVDRNGVLAYVKLSQFDSVSEIQAAIEPLLKP